MNIRNIVVYAVAASGALWFTNAQAEELIYSGFMRDYTQLEKVTDGSADYRYLVPGGEEKMAKYNAVMIDQPERYVFQQLLEFLTRRFSISNVKLDGLPFLYDVRDGHASRIAICSHQPSNQKIASTELATIFVDRDTNLERPSYLLTLLSSQISHRRFQSFERRLSS